MRVNRQLERTLRRYLLGDLPEEARLEVEERVVRDPNVFDALSIVEQELIDEYLDETLPADARKTFERHLLATGDVRRRLDFTRALRDYASSGPAGRLEEPARPLWFTALSMGHPAWAITCAALAVALIGASAWFANTRASLQRDVIRLESQHREDQERMARLTAVLQNSATPSAMDLARAVPEAAMRQEVGRLKESLAVLAPPTFALTAGVLRGDSGSARIAVPDGAEVVRLQLILSGDRHAVYRAVLFDAEGDELWSQSKLTLEASASGPPAISVAVPTRALPKGDYQIRLEGGRNRESLEQIGTYSFRVTTS